MRFYTNQHEHYFGIDLHTNKMYLCILDRNGERVLHRNIRTSPEHFLSAIKLFRKDLVVSAECLVTWDQQRSFALSILVHELGRAVYYMLKNKKSFDMEKFLTA